MCVQNQQMPLLRRQLTYLAWQDLYDKAKPYQVLMDVPPGRPKSNCVFEEGPQEDIHDVRGHETSFNLDNNGFMYRDHVFDMREYNEETIEGKKGYLDQVASFIKQNVSGADEVFCFNWQIRTSDNKKTDKQNGDYVYLDDSMEWIKPVSYVHVDQTPGATEKRVRHHMGERASDLLEGRFRIINVWKPMHNTIEDYPLAVGDGSRVVIKDCVGVDHIRRHYVGESNYPLYSPDYKWYFLSNQSKDEVLIFKTHDSDGSVQSMCCPHTSFKLEDVRHDAPPRESIEVRALVFTHKH